MCSIHASTISHSAKSGQFNKINTCNPILVETSVHLRVKVANWNISCQEWLRKCIYERLHFKDKSKAALATFMVSAFWHGTYIGYYISFFLWFAQVNFSTTVYKEFKKEKSPWKTLYKLLGPLGFPIVWVLSSFTFTCNGAYFQVLQGRVCIEILNALYWIPPMMLFSVIALFSVIKGKSKKHDAHK
jgi:hypothetical protein